VLACRVLGRFTVFVDSTDRSQGMSLLMHGHWEMATTELICSLVKPGMTVVDAGACWGYFSVLMAHLVGASGRIHSIEPNSRSAELLAQTMAVNGFKKRSFLHNVALGDSPADDVSFVSRPGRFMNNHLLRAGELTSRPETAAQLAHVCVRTLDSLIPSGPVDFVKIDVEGAEREMLLGMTEIVQRSRNIRMIMEFNAGRVQAPADFLEELLQKFPQARLRRGNETVEVSRDTVLNSAQDVFFLV
jgi:FkbM family methyltransferase